MVSSQILQHTIVREKLRYSQPDIYIDMPVSAFGVLDFHRFEDILKASEPAKDLLRRQLERVMNTPTLRSLPPKSGV